MFLLVGLVVGIALVDFLAQNTRSVQIEFFAASGHVPVVVALLVAALSGAVLVFVIGLAHRAHRVRGSLRSTDLSAGTTQPLQANRRVQAEEPPRGTSGARDGERSTRPEDTGSTDPESRTA